MHMNNLNPNQETQNNGLLAGLASVYKDYRIHCNTCQFEGPMAEFQSGCPKCREKSNLVPLTATGEQLESLGLRKKIAGFRFWLVAASGVIIYFAYKFLYFNQFLPVMIAVVAVDLIIIVRQKGKL